MQGITELDLGMNYIEVAGSASISEMLGIRILNLGGNQLPTLATKDISEMKGVIHLNMFQNRIKINDETRVSSFFVTI